MVKNSPANARDAGSIPGSGRSLGEGNGNPLQYSCLENYTTNKKKKERKKITWTEEPGRPQSMWLQGVRHD